MKIASIRMFRLGVWAFALVWWAGYAHAGVLDIPAGDYNVTDANVADLAAYDAVNLVDESSRLVFDLASDAVVSCLVTNNGSVVKRGSGKLTLSNGTIGSGFKVTGGWHVENGTLEFPKEPTATSFSYSLEVKSPGVFCVPTHSSKTITSSVTFLGGDGMVTNTVSQTADDKMAFLVATGEFSGTISRFIKERVSGTFNMYGTDNTAGNQCCIGWESQGILGAFSNASIGNAYNIKFDGGNSTIKYLGAGGDTFSKRFAAADRNSIIDGGNGGLTLAPLALTLSSAKVANFTLTGSAGTNTLTASAAFSGTRGRMVKDGDCAWFFKHNRSNWKNGGAVEVHAGKLIIDYLADKDNICPLGLGTSPTKSPTLAVNYSASYDVPYGLLLSGGELEYIGTTNQAFAADRGIGVSADSRITDNGAARFGFDGVTCVGETPRTLTLAGTSALSHLFNVSDGDAALSLDKEGDGTWTLCGALTFSGRLRVKEGKVVVKADSADAKYTWFRLNVMERGGTGACTYIKHFGLFDSDGNRLGTTVADAPTYGAADLQPNEIGWGRDAELFRSTESLAQGVGTPANMFKENDTYCFRTIVSSGAFERPVYAETNKWQKFVVRLPSDIAEVASYDIVTHPKNATWSVTAWRLDGSRDGFHWDILDEQRNPEQLSAEGLDNSKWVYDNTTAVAGGTHSGFPVTGHAASAVVASQLANATVEVAPGAELAADGAVEISHLRVDPATGAGTLRGFSFASSGVLELPDEIPSEGVGFSVGVVDCNGFTDVSNWTIIAGGVQQDKFRMSARADGTVRISKPGFVIIFK